MTPEEEIIIEIGLAIVKDIYPVAINEKTAEAKPSKISLYAYGKDGCYVRNGWSFIVSSTKLYGDEPMIFSVDMLDDGTPVSTISFFMNVCESVITWFVIYKDGKYRRVNEESYYAHNNFDFSKGFEIEIFDSAVSNKQGRRKR